MRAFGMNGGRELFRSKLQKWLQWRQNLGNDPFVNGKENIADAIAAGGPSFKRYRQGNSDFHVHFRVRFDELRLGDFGYYCLAFYSGVGHLKKPVMSQSELRLWGNVRSQVGDSEMQQPMLIELGEKREQPK